VTPAVERVRAVRERLLEEGAVVTRADGVRRELFPVAIGAAEGSALRDCVVAEHAKRTIEVGLGFAISTLFLCEALLENGPDARHVAIDPYQLESLPSHRTAYAGAGLQILEDAGVRDLVDLHAEESQLVLPRLLAGGRTFDLAFVDGNHRFEAVFLDLVYLARLLPERAVVFVDDVQLPGVRRAVDFCVASLGWTVDVDGSDGDAHAWQALRTGPRSAFLRPFDRLADF